MRPIFLLIIILFYSACSISQDNFSIDQLQGAWWSNHENVTADFLIQGDEVWLDYDASFHPCEINGGILIFHLNAEIGKVENRILSISGNKLVLKNLTTNHETVYTRENRLP